MRIIIEPTPAEDLHVGDRIRQNGLIREITKIERGRGELDLRITATIGENSHYVNVFTAYNDEEYDRIVGLYNVDTCDRIRYSLHETQENTPMTRYTIGDHFHTAAGAARVTGEHTEPNGDRILQVTIDTYNQTFDVIDWMLDSPEFEYMGRAQPST